MNLIGISGTNGSGKDTLGQTLANKYGFMFISVTDILRNELKRRGLPQDRAHTRELSAQWRREKGLAVLIDEAVEIFNRQAGKYKGLAVASLRNPGEADRVHELEGKVIWIDAPADVRFKRIQDNRTDRGTHRSVDDNRTFKQFLSDEKIEMTPTGDAATLDMSSVKQKSDIFIENDSNNVQSFLDNIKKSLAL